MTSFSKKVTDLSPQQRRLFELLMNKQGADVSEALILPRRRATDRAPLSFAQQRLWFLHQLEPESPAYNIPTALRLRGPFDIAALQTALNVLVERHEALRTTFEAQDGKPFQRIAPATSVPLDVVDLTPLPETEREASAQEQVMAESLRPFDLSSGPLMRATLFRLAEAEQVLLITLHHILSDGWSMGILVRELTALYLAAVSGTESGLPELPIQYADYALWQQEKLQGAVLEAQLAYWKQQLQGSPTALSFPPDHSRPPVQASRGATEPFELSSALTESLKALSHRAGVTLFMTLLAAFQILLARYTGEDDIVVGSPTSGRSRAEIEGLIGFFVNTLVLRTDLSGNPTFREALGRVREVVRGALAHQTLPFERLVEALQPERDLSRQPLFQVLFVLQNTPMGALELPNLSITPFEIEKGLSAFDVTLQLGEAGNQLVGYLEYSTDLFEAGTIRRLLNHFRTLFEGIVADPDRRLMDLSLMADAERWQTVKAWNDTALAYPNQNCVQLFEAQAEAGPDAVAVEWEAGGLTYGELNRRANQLAHYLRSSGVKPDAVVGLCVERSPEMLIGVLGILKAGGAYLPLDPSYPSERLAFMLEDAGAAVVLTHSHLRTKDEGRRTEDGELKTIYLDTDWPSISQSAISNLQSAIHPDNLAYVIYTSGSTGKPKGVAMPHRPLANLIHWQLQNTALPADAGARTLQFASLSFDVSFQEIFTTWCSGGALILIPDEARRDPMETLRRLEAGAVERLFLPFVALQQLAEAAEAQGMTPAHLREIITAGEQLRITPAIANLMSKLKYGVLHNHYGPSETHVVTALGLTNPPSEWPTLPPIGRPIANTQLYLLDSRLQPVPINVPGELYIGGANVARGYLGRPELTAERFVPNPFVRIEDERRKTKDEGKDVRLLSFVLRLYKTGDLARYLPNGNIEFLGRLDHQVKIRGYRVELGEVEAALNEHAAVRETVVLARDDHAYGKRLVAYVVPTEDGRRRTEDGSLTTDVDLPPSTVIGLPSALHRPSSSVELRAFLKARLPDYLLPSAFVFLDKLPLTPSGKVNRRALPAPDPAQRTLGAAFISPRTPAEEMLAGIWAQVLKVERVGVHDNFFELGGHSLLATQLISRVRAAFNVELPVRAIFETPTVAGLAERIRGWGDQAPTAPPIQRVSRDAPLPLSFAQQRLWFIDQVEPGNPAYNLPFAVRLTGELDVTAFKRTLDEIVRRHEVLRTTFRSIDNAPRQIIAPELKVPLPVVRLQSAGDAQTVEVRQRAIEEAQRPFNLSQGPLIRAQLLRLADHQHVLLLTLHHIISDGWSMEVILREVVMFYPAFTQAQTPTLPELTIQYADFAVWQRAWLQGEVLEKQLAYWQHKLAGHLPVIELPTDRPRPPVQSFHGASQSFELSDDLSRALRDLGQREGCTLFMLLLAGLQVLLYRHSGQTDLLIGADVANRNRAEIESLVGFFVNQLVLRTDLSGELRFRELLARVREVVVDAQAHQDLPFEKLVEVLRPQRSASHTPLFQVKIAFQNLLPASAGLELPGLTLSPMANDAGMTKYDLTLFLSETGPRVLGNLEYSTDLFDAPTISRLVGHYETLLRSGVNQPEADLDELEMLTDAEKEQARREQQARAKTAIKQFKQSKPKVVSLPLIGDEELKG